MTILVVEDDPSILTLIERLLTAKGHAVLTANDPDDAAFVIAERGTAPELLLTASSFPAERVSNTHKP